jgi:ubiquinone/menaquinone biosynthesis C-methylase UbiE
MKDIAKFWDGIAEKYAKSPIRNETAYEHTLGRTRSYLNDTDTALELGCGTGTTAIKLADVVAEFIATDISEGMLELGRRRAAEAGASNVTLQKATAQTAPEGPFDVVLAHNLIHLLDDPDGDLAAVAARVKHGGLFISKTPCLKGKVGSWKLTLIKLALPFAQLLGKAPPVRFMSVEELDAAVTAAGFEIVESGNFPASPPSRYVVARKI